MEPYGQSGTDEFGYTTSCLDLAKGWMARPIFFQAGSCRYAA